MELLKFKFLCGNFLSQFSAQPRQHSSHKKKEGPIFGHFAAKRDKEARTKCDLIGVVPNNDLRNCLAH
ncbi:CLUMA_CG007940, isoform A [Clunio marinus]|uniref:CLUMA_CG007940, isoform A n=1 Tax=Clunio marinus TaxID=568069 RepID=A0A1J1I7Q4_9DIPT|nr:CLUMA_CG007940, isoform A [Clunio marinus]